MTSLTAPKAFAEAAIKAFPPACKAMAMSASRELATLVDDSYRRNSIVLTVHSRQIYVPKRLHFNALEALGMPAGASPAAQCLLTRSTDGQMRQRALRHILLLREPWAIPFVTLLVGEYVVEIVNDVRDALPHLDRTAYANFVRENRPIMRTLRSKATSYWDRYYRHSHPDRGSYPGLTVLNQFDRWAA